MACIIIIIMNIIIIVAFVVVIVWIKTYYLRYSDFKTNMEYNFIVCYFLLRIVFFQRKYQDMWILCIYWYNYPMRNILMNVKDYGYSGSWWIYWNTIKTIQQIPRARPSTTRYINSLFIEHQISRHMDFGCFIGHPLTQNNTTYLKHMQKYSTRINDYADPTEPIKNTNQQVLIYCYTN